MERKRLYTSSRLIYPSPAVRRVVKKLINFRLPVQELRILERYCRKQNLTKTAVFRRFLETIPKDD